MKAQKMSLWYWHCRHNGTLDELVELTLNWIKCAHKLLLNLPFNSNDFYALCSLAPILVINRDVNGLFQ